MRPIVNAPVPTINGVDKSYTDYREWRRDLEAAYGPHCVFCNDRLPNSLQVDHLIARSSGLVNPLQWNNLYFACGPCNLAKSDIPFTAQTHYLPDTHNTHLAFRYKIRAHNNLIGKMACIPEPNSILNPAQIAKAKITIEHLKLDQVEQTPLRERKMTDVRWQNRFDTYTMAITQRKLWDSLHTPEQKTAYLTAISPLLNKSGFFSLWLQAFDGIPEVLREIINTLPNTSINCFDPVNNFQTIPRNPGDIDPI